MSKLPEQNAIIARKLDAHTLRGFLVPYAREPVHSARSGKGTIDVSPRDKEPPPVALVGQHKFASTSKRTGTSGRRQKLRANHRTHRPGSARRESVSWARSEVRTSARSRPWTTRLLQTLSWAST